MVNYLQVGTIITAEDLNEIKEHIEDNSIHDTYVLPPATPISRGGIRPGKGCEVVGDILNVTVESGVGEIPTASESIKGGVKIGHSLIMTNEFLGVALDTIPSTVEGAMWIYDITESVVGGS